MQVTKDRTMTVTGARKFLIMSSLVITGAQMVFLVIAPTVGFPLEPPKNLHAIEVITPVFLGYLGSATYFLFDRNERSFNVRDEFLGMLVIGPIIVYSLVVVSALGAFGYSNRVGVPIGSGMSEDSLNTALSLALGVLAVTTGVISSYLFVGSPQPEPPEIPKEPKPISDADTKRQTPPTQATASSPSSKS
jgi:hypothetical protein